MQDALISAMARVSRSLPAIRGRGRVALALQQRFPGRSGSWTITMRRGHRMEVPANSAQSWRAAFTGCYDDEELDLLESYVAPGSLVLDVGASLGFYTIPLGRIAARAGGRVVAIEPITANCAVLRRNVKLNGLGDVVSVMPFALGREPSEVLLHVETGGTGNATIVSGLDATEVARHDVQGNTGSSETAQVFRLDDVQLPFEDIGRRCSLLKIDAEGFEMDILAGATRFVDEHRPVIFGEFHQEWLETRGVPVSAPHDWADQHGYDYLELVTARRNPLLDHRKVSLCSLEPAAVRSGRSLLLLPRK